MIRLITLCILGFVFGAALVALISCKSLGERPEDTGPSILRNGHNR
jgi:hypothetical protein